MLLVKLKGSQLEVGGRIFAYVPDKSLLDYVMSRTANPSVKGKQTNRTMTEDTHEQIKLQHIFKWQMNR